MATIAVYNDLDEAMTQLPLSSEALGQLLAQKSMELSQLQRTHDEYVRSSCDYERELEIEVDRYEKKTKELELIVSQCEQERSELRSHLMDVRDELERISSRDLMLQNELNERKQQIQRLEQANDQLETCVRIAHATIDEIQHQTETLMEENVFLEHENEELLQKQRRVSSSASALASVHPRPAIVTPRDEKERKDTDAAPGPVSAFFEKLRVFLFDPER